MALNGLKAVGKVFSPGLAGERAIMGSTAFLSRSISDLMALIYHSSGFVGVSSSIALMTALMGKKVVNVGWDGIVGGRTCETHEMGDFIFNKARCKWAIRATSQQILDVVESHLGKGFLALNN